MPKAKRGKHPKGSQIFIKDPLTGARVLSDSIQAGNWPREAQYQPPQHGNYKANYELELSKDAIVLTIAQSDYADDSRDPYYATRFVMRGNYKYSQGKVSGQTNTATSASYKAWLHDSSQATQRHEEEKASYYILKGSPSNPLDIKAFSIATSGLTPVSTLSATEGTLDRSQLSAWTEGRFFPSGWWQDPFAPNLI